MPSNCRVLSQDVDLGFLLLQQGFVADADLGFLLLYVLEDSFAFLFCFYFEVAFVLSQVIEGFSTMAACQSAVHFPVAKKLRRAECAVVMVLDDSEILQTFLEPDSQTEVMCLSQTVRAVGDVEVGKRVAVVVPSEKQPVPWHDCLLQTKYATLTARSVLVGEALKQLEADFSEVLQSYLGMRHYKEMLVKLTKAIKYAGKSLKQHYDTPLAATFGIFSTALVHLLDAEASNDLQKKN